MLKKLASRGEMERIAPRHRLCGNRLQVNAGLAQLVEQLICNQ